MQKYHSYHLRKNSKQWQPINLPQLSQLQAQESLFEISKLDDVNQEHENFLQQLSKNERATKRYQKKQSSSFQKKRQPQTAKQELSVDLKALRQTFVKTQQLGLTSFVVIDNRQHKRRLSDISKKAQKIKSQSIHEHINRKAKYLFRLRNRNKLTQATTARGDKLKQTLYCAQLRSSSLPNN